MTREETRSYVEHWKRVGPLLEAIRREELQKFRYEDNIEAAHSLMQLGGTFGQLRPTSGLVELQRRFQKGRP
jgi:hypothetical protein